MVTNRVYKVLVTTGGASAANLAGVTPGKYIVLKENGTAFAAGDTIAAGDKFQVATGAADGSVIFSDLIALKDVTSYEKTAYRARVEQVVTVTMDTPVAGSEYSILINDKSDKEILAQRQNLRRYSVVALAADTNVTIADKFAAKINADPAAIVTASSATGVLTLTAKSVEGKANGVGMFNDQYFFKVTSSSVQLGSFGYYQPFGIVATPTAPDFGAGNFEQIRTLEQRGLGYTGLTNLTGFPQDTPAYGSVAGTNYDVLVIDFENDHSTNVYTQGRVKAPITLYIAVAAGQATALQAILDPLLGSAPSEAPTVQG